MMIYNKLQECLNTNQSQKIVQILNDLPLKDLKEFIGYLQKCLYTNYIFFSQIKKIIIENFESCSVRNKHILNFLFCINKKDIPKDFDFIIANSSQNVRLLDVLLSGVIRNDPVLLEELVADNAMLSDYHRTVLEKFFIARGKSPNDALKLLNIKQDLLQTKKDRLRVAVLVSGQVRGIEAALASWVKFFDFSDVDLDVFISTWDKSARPQNLDISRVGSDDVAQIIKSSGKESKDILKKLERYLPPYELNEEYFLKIFNKYMKINSINIDIEPEDRYPFFSNSMKLYYKIHRAFEMSKTIGVYDLYIRIRPDLILEGNKIDLRQLECDIRLNNIIYSHYAYVYEYYGFGVDDKIAIAKHDLMEVYANTWKNFDGDKSSMIGHSTLAQNLVRNNISVKSVPNIRVKFTNYNAIDNNFLESN